jgi:hypothetical protein
VISTSATLVAQQVVVMMQGSSQGSCGTTDHSGATPVAPVATE